MSVKKTLTLRTLKRDQRCGEHLRGFEAVQVPTRNLFLRSECINEPPAVLKRLPTSWIWSIRCLTRDQRPKEPHQDMAGNP